MINLTPKTKLRSTNPNQFNKQLNNPQRPNKNKKKLLSSKSGIKPLKALKKKN